MSTWKISLLLLASLLGGCSQIQQLQNMDVSLTNIQAAGSIGLSPRFNIHLLITNPNKQDLKIEGMTLHLDIAGQKILSGVSNQIPTFLAYSETPIEITTTINLFSLYKLINYLSQHSDEDIRYQLKTKIDPQGSIAFTLNEEGLLNKNFLQTLTDQSR